MICGDEGILSVPRMLRGTACIGCPICPISHSAFDDLREEGDSTLEVVPMTAILPEFSPNFVCDKYSWKTPQASEKPGEQSDRDYLGMEFTRIVSVAYPRLVPELIRSPGEPTRHLYHDRRGAVLSARSLAKVSMLRKPAQTICVVGLTLGVPS